MTFAHRPAFSPGEGQIRKPDSSAYLATHLKELHGEARNSIVLSAGDSIGASPVISALFHDEPTVELLNQPGVEASVVGDHEFDETSRNSAGSRTVAAPALLPFSVEFSGGVIGATLKVCRRSSPWRRSRA